MAGSSLQALLSHAPGLSQVCKDSKPVFDRQEAGGLGQVKNSAIHADAWADMKAPHSDEHVGSKEGGAVSVMQ
ncbi:uncharacterized protein RCO7_14451 [Rhynchosporium graminicola]|uniref:Uncharacterized protein n=1 Tax=Rhynchosporium graminicola TaxID=2792576 RepID=A0A1E1KHT0_9HELO|nr:uncharacterized protein RCO7_14451 [Rhynchosporium commune]